MSARALSGANSIGVLPACSDKWVRMYHMPHTVQEGAAKEEALHFPTSNAKVTELAEWLGGLHPQIVIEVMGLIPQWKHHQNALIKGHV